MCIAFPHRSICALLSIVSSLSLSISLVQLYLSDPLVYYAVMSLQQTASILAALFNLAAFLSSGLMRRGPQLYHQVPPIKLGSGLQPSIQEEDEGLRLWFQGEEGGVEPEANVLDYDGCSILDLLAGTYVSTWRMLLWYGLLTNGKIVLALMAQIMDNASAEGVGPAATTFSTSIFGHCERRASAQKTDECWRPSFYSSACYGFDSTLHAFGPTISRLEGECSAHLLG